MCSYKWKSWWLERKDFKFVFRYYGGYYREINVKEKISEKLEQNKCIRVKHTHTHTHTPKQPQKSFSPSGTRFLLGREFLIRKISWLDA